MLSAFLPLIVTAAVAMGLSLVLRLDLAVSAFLFWGVPALYFWRRLKRPNALRALGFAILVTLTIGPVLDYIVLVGHAWVFPSVWLSYRVVGPVTLDECVWLFFYIWGLATIFEFMSRERLHPLGPRFYAGLAGLAAVTMGGYLVVWRWPAAIQSVPYLYLWVDVLLLAVPLAWFWASNARHRRDLLRFAAYLLPVSLANEVVALSLNQWSFPAAAEFVARLPFVGQPLPLEELFFLVFAPPAIMAYYVFLMRDRVQ